MALADNSEDKYKPKEPFGACLMMERYNTVRHGLDQSARDVLASRSSWDPTFLFLDLGSESRLQRYPWHGM